MEVREEIIVVASVASISFFSLVGMKLLISQGVVLLLIIVFFELMKFGFNEVVVIVLFGFILSI